MRILIVDDDRDVAESLAALVRVVLDYDVLVANSGESAIAIAGNYRPDAVILDINMPGLNGLQTAQTLKADRRLEQKAFIACTAADNVFIKKAAPPIGFRQVVIKGNASAVSELIDALSGIRPATRGDDELR